MSRLRVSGEMPWWVSMKRRISTAERSVCAFLLHVWNKYDNAFELPELQGWDQRHQEAFAAWVDGRTLGRPLRYF